MSARQTGRARECKHITAKRFSNRQLGRKHTNPAPYRCASFSIASRDDDGEVGLVKIITSDLKYERGRATRVQAFHFELLTSSSKLLPVPMRA